MNTKRLRPLVGLFVSNSKQNYLKKYSPKMLYIAVIQNSVFKRSRRKI